MTKKDVARHLEEIATLLDLAGAQTFRIRSYQNGARIIESMEEDLATLVAEGRLTELRGIGKALAEKVTELVTTGRLTYLEDLRAEVPPGLVEMLRIPNFGPKKVKLVYDTLSIDTVDALEAAARGGQLAELKGFGEKTQAKILTGIDQMRAHAGRYRRDQGERAVATILDALPRRKADQIEVCGSLRRGNETIKDVDVVVGTTTPAAYLDAFVQMTDVVDVRGQGETKASVLLESGIAADLRVVEPDAFAFAVAYFTGSKEHNIRMRSRALERGWTLNEYGLFDEGGTLLPCADETALYDRLGMDFVPPERREDRGEINLYAAGNDAPTLIAVDDLVGTVHAHTTWSDGSASVEEMAATAAERGARYLVITDHSQAAAYAGGLKPDAVVRQQAEIDAYNAGRPALRVFKGIEVDILGDGRLDYDDELLQTFDVVIASVHSSFQLDQTAMTARIERALRHPRVHILGHPTGRLLLTRDGYALDEDRLIEVAAETGVALEINANPHRLDLDWRVVLRARERGVRFTIGPDAHAPEEYDYVRYGVSVARKGGLTAADVLNTLEADAFIDALR
jgi:DNA polymerase (family 10)